MTSKAASGFAWAGVITVVTKITSFAGQVVLARFLLPQDFGLIALVYGVMVFINLIREAGLYQILNHRQADFKSLDGPAIWMSAILGTLAFIVCICIARPIAGILHVPELKGLLYGMAIGVPFDALASVPTVKVMIDLRFRFRSFEGFAMSVQQMAITILLAMKGYGAFSFVWASVSTSVVGAIIMWAASGVAVFQKPVSSRWMELLKPAVMVVVSSFLLNLVAQTDRFVLQRFRDEATVGIYYFAFTLSTQAIIVTALNLSGILMPILSRLNDDRPRQARAFLRAVGLLMLIGTPLCVGQAVLAGPILRLLFKPEYYAALWPMRLLSFAIVPRLTGYCAMALLQAQGRFRTQGLVMALQFPLTIVGTAIGAYLGGAPGVCIAVLILNTIMDVLLLWLGVSRIKRISSVLNTLFIYPLILSILAVLPVLFVFHVAGGLRGHPVLAIFVCVSMAIPLYAALLSRFMPMQFRELRSQLTHLWQRMPSFKNS